MSTVWKWLLLLTLYVVSTEAVKRCSACQGTAGSDCDISPWNNAISVECEGRCITWRSIYATGRRLRTVWRGCEHTLFPAVLSESYKDTCGYGNFFVECSRTCGGNMCNQNHTGIPNCWSCLGDYQSCDLAPPKKCGTPVTTVAPPVASQLECIRCQGRKGEMCDTSSYLSTDIVQCNSSCVTRRRLLNSDRSLIEVWRGCASTLFPTVLSPEALNSCHSSDNYFIECTSTCVESRCNKYLTGFTDCWTEEGNRKPSCEIEEEPTGFQTDLLENLDTAANFNTSTADDVPEGTLINCTSCQGRAGDTCDVRPHEIALTVSCMGACITRRTLYTTGRRLKSIWRGCDEILFPGILDERLRNTCQTGNFFVECTDTCRTEDKCNQNMTGIPQCRSCLGDPKPCDIPKEKVCIDPEPVRPTLPPRLIQCVSCTSGEGGTCDTAAYTIELMAPCNSSCVTRKLLANESRELENVWRGCYDNSGLRLGELNNCVQTDDSGHISCATACNDPRCNKYSTGFPDCWTQQGVLKDECRGTSPATESILSPSRVSTKKPYSIQDAYGGDNYRGEWRPPDEWEEERNSTDAPDTSHWLGPVWGLSGEERPVALQHLLAVCSLALALLF